MKSFFVGLFVITFAAASHAQSKVMAEQVRSTERIVKGAPFSAEAISESVQTFADGNKIVRSSTSRLYRDGEGRFRRDDMPKQIGLPGAIVEVTQSILILDPVSGSKFILDTKQSTAREMPFKPTVDQEKQRELKKAERAEKEAERISKQRERLEKARRKGEFLKSRSATIKIEENAEMKHDDSLKKDGKVVLDGKSFVELPADNNTKNDSLGVRNFDGIDAEGTRTTTTIPAGKIGNLRDIEVVYERWYSKDLQLLVFATHSDPAFGEQTYRLTNIRRTEPPVALFSPPAGYRIIGAKQAKGIGSGSGNGSGSGSGNGGGNGEAPKPPKPPKPPADGKKPMPRLPSPPKPAKQ